MEQGTGKTASAINVISTLFDRERTISSCLIVCPLAVVGNWKREFDMHSSISQDRIILLKGHWRKRVKSLTFKRGLIFITNYEGLLMEELHRGFMSLRPEIIVFDESHRLKTHNTKRTLQATKIADLAKYKLLLSGTPVLNSAMDLFSQYRIMDGGKSFGKNYWGFRSTYFYDGNRGMPKQSYFPDWKIKKGSFQEINKVVNATSFRVLKKDCLDLPPLVRQRLEVELTLEQRKHYKEMKNHFITYLGSKACVAQLALTKILRLMQIVTGFMKLEDGSIQPIKNNRTVTLKELLETLTPKHKVIVWACFKYNYKQIAAVCKGLGLGHVQAHGGTSAKDKEEAIDRFTNDPQTRVFIGNQGAMGIGINLTVASYSVYYSRNYSLEHDLQSEARNHRGGSEIHEKITRIDLVCPGTVDDLILKALANKEKMGEQLLQAMKENTDEW